MFICLIDDLIIGFCYNNLTGENGGFELASIITLVSQANRLKLLSLVHTERLYKLRQASGFQVNVSYVGFTF